MGTALTGWLARWRPPRRVLVAIAVAVLAGLGALLVWIRSGSDPEELSLGAFESLVEEGEVDTAEIADRSHRVTGELADGDAYEVTYPEEYTDELTSLLVDNGVELDTDAESESFWLVLLWQYLPLVLIAGLVIYLVWSFQGGRGSGRFGRARARRPGGDQPEVTFADVAGCDEAVEELLEVKEFLADPDRFRAIGARIPKGILLYGPPGTGKTLLARAVAGEAGAPFFSISGSDFVEMYVGVGASRVRDLFEQAERAAPAIIFVDEIDAVGRHRGAGLGGGHDEREQTLNQLLVEMDGFDVSTGVILIAASNRPDILDPALLRPGRFDRRIVVDRPDLDGRRAILEVHAAGKPFADDVDLSIVARRTSGFTGADLANVLNEAALLSARRGHDRVTRAEIEEAVDRVMAGPERKGKVMSEREKLVSAYHEAGHALAGHLLPNTDPIHKVSIVARGQALGWTQSLPEEERRLLTRSELRDRMAMLLAGRAAEERTFGEPSTGAQDDIRRATHIARAMVTEYGMSALGPQHVTSEPEGDRSEHVAARIDTEVQRLVDDAHREATEILTLHRSTLDSLADALVEHETLDERALEALLGPARGPGSATERPWSHAPEPAEAAGHMTAVDEGTRLQHGDTGGPAH